METQLVILPPPPPHPSNQTDIYQTDPYDSLLGSVLFEGTDGVYFLVWCSKTVPPVVIREGGLPPSV